MQKQEPGTRSSEPVFDRRQRSWLFWTRVETEVDAELAFHLEMRIRHYLARGMSDREARARACRDFGDVDHVRRACRTLGHQRDEAMRRTQYLDEVRQDVIFTLRQFRVAPGFAIVALLTLALGIGATTAIFSLVRGVLLTPLPYTDPDRLVATRVSLPDYRDLKAAVPGFSQLAVWASNQEALTGSGEPEQVLSGQVSAELFDTLGVKPAIGRTFSNEDGPSRLVVLSHGLWQRRFGGDRAIVGRTIELGRQQAVVIGVMPPTFEFPSREYELWMPLAYSMSRTPDQAENRAFRIFRAIGRLAPGVTLAQVQSQADAVARRLQKEFPTTNAGVDLTMVPLYERLVGEARRPLLMLLAVVTLVLLIACINVANLLLARALTRERELSIRAALGAGRGRLVRQLLTESVLLAVCGGALGFVAARATFDALVRLLSPLIPRLDAIQIDGTILLFAIAVSTLTGIAFGLAPSLQRQGGALGLREGGRGVAGQAQGRRLRSALITLEVALASVVLVCAGLLLRSLSTLGSVDPGFIADRLLTMNVVLVAKGEGPARAAAARALVERVSNVPGVEAVGGATGLPPETPQRAITFEAEGVPPLPDNEPRSGYFIAATPGYFKALGTRPMRGRAFDARDAAGGPPVVIINESLARSLYAGQDPIGRRLRLINPEQSRDWRTIVGVVPDVRYRSLEDEGTPTVYTPFDQTPFFWSYVFVRTHGEPAALRQSIARAITENDPELIPMRIRPMSELVAKSVEARRASALLLSAFALVALTLAAIGIGGLVSYAVSRRTSEMAVRLALGATPSRVLRLVLSQALTPVLAGAVVGLAGAMAATRLVESLLFGVTPYDGWTFLSAASVLCLVALAAAYLPARRALGIAPADALRIQ